MLKELIKKLDQSTPSRELDLEIYQTLWPESNLTKMTTNPLHSRGFDRAPGYSWEIQGKSVVFEKRDADYRCPHNGGYPLPHFTSSIDDALTLLRKHYLWQLKCGIHCIAIVWWLEHDWDCGAPSSETAGHPALALTIAALIARALEGPSPTKDDTCPQ